MIDPSDIKVWYPETDRKIPAHEGSVSFLTYCLEHKKKGALAQRSEFNPDALKKWLGNIMVLEFDPEREDFRYRLYGSGISALTGFDMTGKWVSEFRSEIGEMFRTQYLKAVREKCLIVSRNPYLHSRAPCDWERIICPVASGDHIQLVVSNHMVELTGAVLEARQARLIANQGHG